MESANHKPADSHAGNAGQGFLCRVNEISFSICSVSLIFTCLA